MWSHYADHHRGVAIGLDGRRVGPTLPGTLGKVRYNQNRCRVDWSLEPTTPIRLKQTLKTIFTKSKDWEYEQEYRRVFRLCDLICLPDASGRRHYFIDILSGAILEIVFGCCIKRSDEDAIRQELRRRPRTFGHVKLFRCKRHATRFEMELVAVY